MKLSECRMGVIVQRKVIHNVESPKVGMIVGITTNAGHCSIRRDSIDKAIPLVQWSGSLAPVGVHPDNLIRYED